MSRVTNFVSTRHVTLVLAGLLFLGAADIAISNQGWTDVAIALVLVQLVRSMHS